MRKILNRLLKLVGLNLVRAKGPRRKAEAPKVLLSKYQGEYKWQSLPPVVPNPNKTHYVGDDCPGGHGDLIGCEAKVQVVDSNAAFVPVDIHELSRIEQPNSDNKIGGPTS